MQKASFLWYLGHVLSVKTRTSGLSPQSGVSPQYYQMSFYREAGGGGVTFLLRFVGEHLTNVNNYCYGRWYGKSHILLIGFLNFHSFNAGNRVRFFQESIPKCLKVTILPFEKSGFCNRTWPFFEYNTTLTKQSKIVYHDVLLFWDRFWLINQV